MIINPKNEIEYNTFKNTPGKLVVVFFNASWHRQSKSIVPTFFEFSNKYKDEAVFISVDVDQFENATLEDLDDVKTIPFFKFFHNGMLLQQFSGAYKSNLYHTIETQLNIHFRGK